MDKPVKMTVYLASGTTLEHLIHVPDDLDIEEIEDNLAEQINAVGAAWWNVDGLIAHTKAIQAIVIEEVSQ